MEFGETPYPEPALMCESARRKDGSPGEFPKRTLLFRARGLGQALSCKHLRPRHTEMHFDPQQIQLSEPFRMTQSYAATRHTQAQSSMRRIARTILEDRRRNTVYTVVAFRHLSYEDMLASVRRFYRTWHPRRRTWLKDHRITIWSDIGLQD